MERLCIIIPSADAQKAKKLLKYLDSWDGTRRLMTIDGKDTVAIPVTTKHHDQRKLLDLVREKISPRTRNLLELREMELPAAKKLLVRTPQKLLSAALTALFEEKGVAQRDELRHEIPDCWEKHGDLVLLPDTAFSSDDWKDFGEALWQAVCMSLQCQRLARKSVVTRDGYRTPQVELLYGDDGWVEHMDNGIRYTYDVTKCMFSSGNITEKLRVSRFDCSGEVVVDLYTGIGYFTLPYLVYTGVKHLHACEWNPDAVEALRRNLRLNGVEDRCTVHVGDNRKVCPKEVADRVNLGLIPSSEPGWRTACMALKSLTGGILHIHGNVNTRKGCGENINVDSHTDSSEKTAANLVSGKGNDILEDGSLGENFQWDTTKAGIDCNTEPCSSDVKHCGIVENDINDLYHNKGTKEIKIGDFHKADLDHTLEEKDMTKDNISRTEGVASLGFDTDCIKTVEHSGASVANEDPKLYLTEKKEKLSETSKALFTKDGTKVQALGHESSIQSKWLLWAVGVSGKIRNILKEVHGGNEDMHKISKEFDSRPDWTTEYGVSCP